MKRYFFAVALFLTLIVACAPVNQEQIQAPQEKPKPIEEKSAEKPKPPEEKPEVKPENEITPEVQELFNKSKIRLKSISYLYKGPETGNNFYEFYVKDTKIKYIPYREVKSLDLPDSYDTIYINKILSSAQSYCIAAYCKYKGKKQDLNYDDAYILTIFDWIDSVKKAEKVGEEVVDDRTTWKIDTDEGVFWVDIFYGIPLKIESGSKEYMFQKIAANSVRDEDLVPP